MNTHLPLKIICFLITFLVCSTYTTFSFADNTATSPDKTKAILQKIKVPETFPQMISEFEFYNDIKEFKINPAFIEFRPNYPLWTDGALKTRWVYFPPGTQIDNSDPNAWVFPKGTIFVKEFRKTVAKDLYSTQELKVETRILAKKSDAVGKDAWHIVTYAWDREQNDAKLSSGFENVIGTNHDIPTLEQCIQCHQGNKDLILGFDAIQLTTARSQFNINAFPAQYFVWTIDTLQEKNMLTHPFKEEPEIPGTTNAKRALGYMHGNCGHCHNPRGEAFKQDVKHMILKHNLLAPTLEETDVYKTTVNKPSRNFKKVPYLVKGARDDEMAIYESALYVRMNSLLPKNRMPQIGRKVVDYYGLERMHAWLQTLKTPDDLDLAMSQSETSASKTEKPTGPLEVKNPSGLVVQANFVHPDAVPKVLIVYLPEDESLESQPILDHDYGDFTENLIVGAPGEEIVLRNSDEIAHTIYAVTKDQKRVWDVDFMPANTSTSRPLSWETDEFVEMKCKLHDYMQAWAGAIKTKYYKIVNLEEGQQERRFQFGHFPPEFTQIKVWMPDYEPIAIELQKEKEMTIDLIRKNKKRGELILKRN